MNVYKEAVEKWGCEPQINQAIEEMAELMVAFNKLRRNRTADTYNDVCEEIADVEIMMAQMREYFNQDIINQHKVHKINRLKRLLKKC